MSPESSPTESRAARRARGSSQRAAARAQRSRGTSRSAIFLRVVLAVVLIASGSWLAWWAFHPRPAAEEASVPESATQSPTLALFDRVTVSGRVGATPTIEIKAPLEVDGFKARVLEAGSGREITEGSPVLVSVTAFDGNSGRMLSESGRPQMSLGIVGSGQIDEDLSRLVTGKREGTRVLAFRSITMGDGSTNTIEVDVVDILPSIATGTSVDASVGPMSVEMSPEGPIISHIDTLPGGVTTQTLIKGDGVQVHEGDRVVAQFTVLGWTDGTVRVSTWETGVPEVINLGTAMKGLATALVDQKVGSRLAITIPPDLAAGDDTLCVVIDILGTEPGAATNGDQTPQS
ncbi:Uncharacterised protein [uncultured Actinomyces sp.]|nr:Uncharacterised protein [uncultured Actinomyces sp.]